MATDEDIPVAPGRRAFLGTVVSGSAVAAGVAAAGRGPALERAGAPPAGEAGSGYRLTEHIRTYYRTMLI